MIMAITTTNTILGILIIFSGIALLRYFAQRKGETSSYKPALFIYVIWFIISFFGLSFLYLYISSFYFSFTILVRAALFNIHSISTIIIEVFFVSILVKSFYKINFKDSVFITIQVISVQIFMRIIVVNILAILFNLSTGGFISLYIFQY